MNMVRVIKRYPHYNTLAVVDEEGEIYSVYLNEDQGVDNLRIGEYVWGYSMENREKMYGQPFVTVRRATYEEVEERSKMKWNRINERMNIFSDDVFSEYDFWV